MENRPATEVLCQGKPVAQRTLRVVIADDYEVMRTLISDILVGHGLMVVGLATSGEDAICLAQKLNPDIVLMDIDMPGMGGIAATAVLQQTTPATRVVGLSFCEDRRTIAKMMAAGAYAYVSKAMMMSDLVSMLNGMAHQG